MRKLIATIGMVVLLAVPATASAFTPTDYQCNSIWYSSARAQFYAMPTTLQVAYLRSVGYTGTLTKFLSLSPYEQCKVVVANAPAGGR